MHPRVCTDAMVAKQNRAPRASCAAQGWGQTEQVSGTGRCDGSRSSDALGPESFMA
ncbi:hypothetical protein GCM10023203_57020 [Actinomycetospora straminea]|uniref:Uncharacterized protein n=1 Tax=Actinomycetospora straminea TaxID=663607 RepID=A0ABP9F8L2_9PSEU